MGTIHIKCGKGRRLTLKDALYIPDVKLHLVSIGHLSDDEFRSSFTTHSCTILHGSKTIAKGLQHGKGLYMLTESASMEHMGVARTTPTLETWHR